MALPTRVPRGYADTNEGTQREFENLMSRFFGGYESGADGGGRLAPFGVDIREDADHFYVEADLPGFRKEDIEITLENQTLTIAAERRQETAQPAPQAPQAAQPAKGKQGGQAGGGGGEPQRRGQEVVHLRERRYTRFLRSFTLPPIVDEGSVAAKLHDGVLTITISKREETKPRKIQVG